MGVFFRSMNELLVIHLSGHPDVYVLCDLGIFRFPVHERVEGFNLRTHRRQEVHIRVIGLKEVQDELGRGGALQNSVPVAEPSLS